MAGVGAALLALGAVGIAALGLEGFGRRMFKRWRGGDVDDEVRAGQVITEARQPEPDVPDDPPEWEAVAGEPWGDAVTAEITRIKDSEEAQVPVEGDGAVAVRQDAGHAQPGPVHGTRVVCHECQGAGFLLKSTNELLGESLALIPEGQGDAVIREFYRRLVAADNGKDPAEQLTPLFPPDLLTDDAMHGQRDKLLHALMALAQLYNPDDAASMERLDHALASYGRHHALFTRPDGSVRGASFGEYVAVRDTLFSTLHDVAGSAWRPEYDAAWAEAYDHAAERMLTEAHRVVASGEFSMPRLPREARDG